MIQTQKKQLIAMIFALVDSLIIQYTYIIIYIYIFSFMYDRLQMIKANQNERHEYLDE